MGGKSSEHDVSLVSAKTVIENIDKDLYNVIMVGITKDGQWKLVDRLDHLEDGSWVNSKTSAYICPDTGRKELLLERDGKVDRISIDVVFPVLHGMNGEDGTVQGLLELAAIPYVGCGVLASACSMDKFYTKIVVDSIGVRQAKFVGVRRHELTHMDEVVARVEAGVPYPVFVKPSKAGSSQGVSKAENREELIDALNLAAKHDSKILVEETIVGREIECGVLGMNEPKASGVGEVLSAEEFYSYDKSRKYLYTEETLQEVCLGIHSMCVGAESKYFNGHTNITDDAFLVFGVKGLLDTNKRLKDAMLFNILSFMSNQLLGKGNTAASIDELYLFLTNMTAIEYIRNAMKRVRKKDSSIILASQNIEDFLIPSIREFTKPLFSIPTHQFLFNAGPVSYTHLTLPTNSRV